MLFHRAQDADRGDDVAAPSTFDDLSAHIARRHDKLSARLRTIAAFAVQNPNDVALSTVSVLAKRIGVQPSAIVRFANDLGYGGFTEMQQVFRTRLVAPSMPSYRERISQLRNARDGQSGQPGDVLAEFVADDIASLENLYRLVPFDRLEKAISILAGAETIYLFAQGRSFPIAYYLDYGLTRLDLRSHFFDSIGGLVRQRTRVVTKKDAMIIVSFKDYAADVVEVGADIAKRDIPLIVITDNPLGPFAKFADVCFELGEARYRPFRSLVAPICLAQSIVVGLGHRLAARPGEKNGKRR
jgi:DNA-binding MurR/RpiR family transcriptional regulator